MPQFLSIVCDLEPTNQLNLLPDKDLVDLCHPTEPYQVTKNQKIDQLWLHYSHGHFGFSIQQAIFSSLGGLVDYETHKKLGDQLGWRKEGQWLNYEQLNFQLEPNSPLGHLPVHWLIFEENLCYSSAEVSEHQNSVAFWRVGNWLLWQLHLVFSKIQACGIIPLSDF